MTSQEEGGAGGIFTLVVSETNTIADTNSVDINTGITDADLGGDVLFPAIGLSASNPGQDINLDHTPNASGSDLQYFIYWNDTNGRYQLFIKNNEGTSLDVTGKVFRG